MYSQTSKVYSFPCTTYTVQDSLHLHASNASHIFGARILLVTSQRKVLFMYS